MMFSRRGVLCSLKDEESHEPPRRRPRYAGRYPRNFAEKYKEHSGDADTISKVLAKGMTPAGRCGHVSVCG
jgi:16S rRNA (cytosine1402-N4)-methyltransferase